MAVTNFPAFSLLFNTIFFRDLSLPLCNTYGILISKRERGVENCTSQQQKPFNNYCTFPIIQQSTLDENLSSLLLSSKKIENGFRFEMSSPSFQGAILVEK